MGTNNSHAVEVGQIFTPLAWAKWLINRWGIFDAWIDGAAVCDPTAGRGAFALALFHLARAREVRLSSDLLSRLTLIEVHPSHLRAFEREARRDFGIDFPASQLLALDVITSPPNAEPWESPHAINPNSRCSSEQNERHAAPQEWENLSQPFEAPSRLWATGVFATC